LIRATQKHAEPERIESSPARSFPGRIIQPTGLAAVMAGFGSVISEVGASMMVGGNIRGQTRVLTTAIVLETSKGEFEQAIALSLLLLAITFLINWALTWIQQRGKE